LAGAAVSEAEVRKSTKYSNFIHSHIFIPLAIETLEVWGLGAIELVNALGRRLLEATRKYYPLAIISATAYEEYTLSRGATFRPCKAPFQPRPPPEGISSQMSFGDVVEGPEDCSST